MKITVSDASMVNWEKVEAAMKEACAKKITEVTDEAMEALADLKPGQRKTFPIKIGSITVSKPKE